MPVIGFLSAQSADDDYKNFTVPFLQGLKEAGYVEGQNVAVEYRWAENQIDRLPAVAADLLRGRIAVVVAADTPAALAAKTRPRPYRSSFPSALTRSLWGAAKKIGRPPPQGQTCSPNFDMLPIRLLEGYRCDGGSSSRGSGARRRGPLWRGLNSRRCR
jgi:hypothetical protein